MDFNVMTREAYERLAKNFVPHDDNPQLPQQQPAPPRPVDDPSAPFHAGCDD